MKRVTYSALNPKNPGINRLQSDRQSYVKEPIGATTEPWYQSHHQIWNYLTHYEDPWTHFLIWESEWQVQEGITNLRRAPFLSWMVEGSYDRKVLLRSKVYPDLVKKESQESLMRDVQFVTAAIRQAKEYYQAGSIVSELTQPTMMFYSALMLSQAAAVALFGKDFLKPGSKHGLVAQPPGRDWQGLQTDWPTTISWKAQGDFVALYQTVRWDNYEKMHGNPAQKEPRFHIMECLRCAGLVNNPAVLGHALSTVDHLLWSDNDTSASGMPTTLAQAVETPCYEVPHIIVLFMILFWLSVMSRYYPVTWQQLLAGRIKEGYYLRRALTEVPADFVRAMHEVMPTPDLIGEEIDSTTMVDTAPSPGDLQEPHRLAVYNDENEEGEDTR
ncbi:MAG: hypothetical protein M1294_13895 [Firmicutes bacterium]|nr:hypothetical protein [Bacillota bacterium]